MDDEVLSVHWSRLYAEDLDRFPALRAALEGNDPVGTVAKHAKLSELEVRVLRMWAGGDSWRDIALALGRTRSLVEKVLLRAKCKVLQWVVRDGWRWADSL